VTEEQKQMLAAIQAFQANMHQLSEQRRKWQEAENARRAKLTAAQRLAEDRATERKHVLKLLAKVRPAIEQRDTWTLDQFAWLLAAENPEDESFGFFGGRSSKGTDLQKHFRTVLESCIHTRLKAVNPAAPADQQRFTVQSLIDVAAAKQLGCYRVLAELTKHEPPVAIVSATSPAPVEFSHVSPTEKPGRETKKKQRQTALVKFARSLVKEGVGTEDKNEIRLSILGVELNERFRAANQEWKEIADKTLETDRRESHPRISVRTGRRHSSAS
jgi:hypothetical protein